MFEFKQIQELKPNIELLEILKPYKYKVNKGKIKHLLHTNLHFIESTKYLITYPTTITILEYKVNEINSKNFYIKQYCQKYNLKEIISVLKNYKFILKFMRLK